VDVLDHGDDRAVHGERGEERAPRVDELDAELLGIDPSEVVSRDRDSNGEPEKRGCPGWIGGELALDQAGAQRVELPQRPGRRVAVEDLSL
jgi:hypothetical protein